MSKVNRFFKFRDPNDERPKKVKNEEVVDIDKLEKDAQTVIGSVINLLEAIQKQDLQREKVIDSIISLLQQHRKQSKESQKEIESLDNLLKEKETQKAIDSLINVLDPETRQEIRESLIYFWWEYTQKDTTKSINSIMSLLGAQDKTVSKAKQAIESLLNLFAELCKKTDSSDYDGYSSAEEYLEDSSED